MNRGARFVITEDDFLSEEPLVIKDIGPWDKYLTVTNDAEAVVESLYATNDLHSGRRLFYYDSAGEKDEILHRDGRFVGFAPIAPPSDPDATPIVVDKP
jgi:hypothetical protein